MGKLTNLKYPLKYTSTDFIAYTGKLPDCIPSGTSSCEPMDRSLTKLFQLVLEKYCEPSANPLDVDISEFDIECLIEANPDIEIGEDLTLADLLTYYKEHLCYIYTRLCDICCDECGSPETICTVIKPGDCSSDPGLSFKMTINYLPNTDGTIDFIFANQVIPDVDASSIENIIQGIVDGFDDTVSGGYTVITTSNSIEVIYNGETPSTQLFQMLASGGLYSFSNPPFTFEFLQGGGSSTWMSTEWTQPIYFNSSPCPDIEVTGTVCDFIQDHEDRITELENTPSSEPYVPEPLVIPIYRVMNIQNQSELILDISKYFKYKTSEYYLSKTEDGTRLDSLTQNAQSSLGTGTYGKLWLDSDTDFMRYLYTEETPFPTGDDDFEFYLTDGSGSSYLIPITISTINACCAGEPAPSGEGFLYDYIIEFDVTGWNTEEQFEGASATVDRDPTGGLQTATPQSSFVLRLNHNLGIIGTYTAVPVYLYGVGGAISTSGYNTDYVDIQLVNNPFNILGTNIRVKVTIYQ